MPAAKYFGQPTMADVLKVSSLVFLVNSIATPLLATLRRDMNFRATAILSVVGGLATLATSCACALFGFGALSMAYGGVAGAIMTTVACLYLRPWFWVYRPSFAGSGPMLSFGGFSSVTALMNVGYQLLPQLALGRLIGFDAVGQYNRAATLCQIPERVVVGRTARVVGVNAWWRQILASCRDDVRPSVAVPGMPSDINRTCSHHDFGATMVGCYHVGPVDFS